MSNEERNIFQALKKYYTVAPPQELDQKILNLAKVKLSESKKNYSSVSAWPWLGLATACGLTIIFAIHNYRQTHSLTDKIAFDESIEMVLNYRNLELMAEASNLSDDEWKKIEEVKQ